MKKLIALMAAALICATAMAGAHRVDNNRPMRVFSTTNNPDDTWKTYLDQSFAWCAGTLESPIEIELDEEYFIPVELIGADSYGYGGVQLKQAGGALMICAPDGEGLFWTPLFGGSSQVIVSFKVRSYGDNIDDMLEVQLLSASGTLDTGNKVITQEWADCSFTLDGNPEEEMWIEMFADRFDMCIKDLKVEGVVRAVTTPQVLPHSDYTGTSFVANWAPVKGATAYVLDVMEWNDVNYQVKSRPVSNRKVQGTSSLVDGIEPGKIYFYQVQATDGRNFSDPSAEMRVAALTAVTDVKAAFNEEGNMIAMSWSTVPFANYYEVEMSSHITADSDIEFTLAEADFSDEVFGETDMEYPYEPEDDWVVRPTDLHTWAFVAPVMVDGAYGVTLNDMYSMFGYPGMIQSPVYDLSQVKDGAVHLEFDAASGFANPFNAILATYVDEVGAFAAMSRYDSSVMDIEFEHYAFTLKGAGSRTFIDIRPESMGHYTESNIFLRNIKVTCNLEAGKSLRIPIDYLHTDGSTTLSYAMRRDADIKHSIVVTAYQKDEYGQMRLSGTPSDRAMVAESAGVDDVAVDEALPVEYYNLQGIKIQHPMHGQIVIRRQGTRATKVIM